MVTLRLQYCYEDSMDMIAKLPTIAAIIYRNLYRGSTSVGAIDMDKDWSWNFTQMLGYDDPDFVELMRLYLTIHRYVDLLSHCLTNTIHVQNFTQMLSYDDPDFVELMQLYLTIHRYRPGFQSLGISYFKSEMHVSLKDC